MGNIIWGVATLLSIGFNGLLITLHKLAMDEMEADAEHIAVLEGTVEELNTEVTTLRNRLTPWNKGKTGYKHKPRATGHASAGAL